MPASRFDIAIVGDSLASRMVAAVLAKHGKRVLLFSAPTCHETWHTSSLFVGKIIAGMGGNAQLTPAQPFQVLSSRARLTITPGRPLLEELQREFGTAAPSLVNFLARLKNAGTALEELFREHGGLPESGFADTMRWRWLCLRRKFPLGALSTPLARTLHVFPEAATEWLRDLFQGLSLLPIEALSQIDGALLWANANHSGGMSDNDLRELLHKRFEQFHGVETDLQTLRSFEHTGGHWEYALQNGGHFRSDQLIIGDLGRELPGRGIALPRPSRVPARHFATSPLNNQLSPLLTQRFIPGGPVPMRFTANTTPEGIVGQVGVPAGTDDGHIQTQLAPFLPFARYSLSLRDTGKHVLTEPDANRALFKLPYRLGSHLWCADETRLLPHLGTGGAALLAWTIVRKIEPSVI